MYQSLKFETLTVVCEHDSEMHEHDSDSLKEMCS